MTMKKTKPAVVTTATEATAKNTKRLLDARVDNGMRFA